MNIKVNQSKNKFTNREKERILSDYSNTINPNNKFDINAAKVANILTGEKPKNNKESRNLIQTFLQDIDVESLSTVFILAGTLITSAIKFYRNMRKLDSNIKGMSRNLNESKQINFYEPIDDFNIDNDDVKALFNTDEFKNLNESQQLQIKDEINDSNIKKVLDDKKYQFEFESGNYMEAINSNKLSDIPFSLKYHKNNTKNLDEFILSVKKFIENSNGTLTEEDINRLGKHYNKYN